MVVFTTVVVAVAVVDTFWSLLRVAEAFVPVVMFIETIFVVPIAFTVAV